jgi:hypothetical protein
MKPEAECELAAKSALEQYVNVCDCRSLADVQLALNKMIAVAMHAKNIVGNGKMEIVQ